MVPGNMAITHWLTLADGPKKRIRLFVMALLWILATLSLFFLLLAILHSFVAVTLALAAGAAIRCLGQWWNMKRLHSSGKAAELATFSCDGRAVICDLDEVRTLRFLHAWQWRIAACVVAGGVCMAAQYASVIEISLLPTWLFSEHWMQWTIESFSRALPAFACAFFLVFRGPKRRWINQAKSTVQARADRSIAAILAKRELDGLGAGIEFLWRELKIDRCGEYRAAINRRLQSYTAEAVMQPQTTAAVLESITELARQDLRRLCAAVKSYRLVESQLKVIEALANLYPDPVNELCVEELRGGLNQIYALAENRQWDALEQYSASLKSRMDAAQEKICRNASTTPRSILATGSSPYRLLGVAPDTPTLSIRKLWLRLAHLYHPDMSGSTYGSAKMAELNAAYAAIMKDRESARG